MTEIVATGIKYSEPAVFKAGGLLFAATNIEVPATAEEYVEGGIKLNPEKLGLTDGVVKVASSVGETASTTAFPGIVWCNPVITLAKEANEEAKLVAEGIIAQVTMIKGIPWLRVYSIATAGIGKPFAEPKTSTKVKLGIMSVTVFAVGQ